jgi:cytochrome P450
MTAGVIASTEMMLFLTPIIAERRRRPGQDFISALLALVDGADDGVQAAGDRTGGLTLREVLATCILLLAAGHETTANLITNSTLALLIHPGQQPYLHADPERAVEELLRLHGAAKLVGRTATFDQDLAGTRVPAGAAVLVDLHQANRDPDRHLDPARMDLSREPAGHLAFGAGWHFCLGAALARLQTVETLTRTFTRYPDLTLVTRNPRWRGSSTFHGMCELPVRTGARASRARRR